MHDTRGCTVIRMAYYAQVR